MIELQITTQQAVPHTAGRPVVDVPVVGSGASVPELKPSAITAPDPVEVQRQVEEAVQWLNQQVEKLGRSVGFSVDSVAGRNVVTVRDKTSGEVVRRFRIRRSCALRTASKPSRACSITTASERVQILTTMPVCSVLSKRQAVSATS